MSERRIVIVGAGIGGLAAALALFRAGYTPIVVERVPALSEIGAGIQLSPNAMRVLATLGVADAIAERATEPEAIVVRNGVSGRTLVTLRGSAFHRRYGEPYRVIHRADLQAVLVDAVRATGIDLHTDATIANLHPTGNGITVEITAGKTANTVAVTVGAEAVISADGVRSSTRHLVPGAATVIPAHRTAWRATIPARSGEAATVGLWLGPRAHLVHYPLRGGTAMNVIAIIDAPWNGGGWAEPGDPGVIAKAFAKWTEPARSVVAAGGAWQTFALATVDPTAPWVDGRIALLGDAAHAMQPYLAQGAAMALEDATVLAARLAGASDVPAALRRYEAERKTRVARVAAASARTGAWYHAALPLSAARDTGLRVGGEALLFAMNDWIYRWRPPLITPSTRSSQ